MPKRKNKLPALAYFVYPLAFLLWVLDLTGQLITLPALHLYTNGEKLVERYLPVKLRKKIKVVVTRLLASLPVTIFSGQIFKPIHFALFGVSLLTVTLIYGAQIILSYQALPTPYKLQHEINPLTTKIYDRHGKLLYEIYEGRDRTPVRLSEVPKELVQATIAVEDKNFYTHPATFNMKRSNKADPPLPNNLLKTPYLQPIEPGNVRSKRLYSRYGQSGSILKMSS
jgi:hypothetical protein